MTNYIIPGDDLVEKLELYVKRPPLLHGYALPYLSFYVAGAAVWYSYFSTDQYEVGAIILATVAMCHMLTILFSVWSVDVRCWLACSRVSFT